MGNEYSGKKIRKVDWRERRRRKRKYWNIYLPPTLFRRHCKNEYNIIFIHKSIFFSSYNIQQAYYWKRHILKVLSAKILRLIMLKINWWDHWKSYYLLDFENNLLSLLFLFVYFMIGRFPLMKIFPRRILIIFF